MAELFQTVAGVALSLLVLYVVFVVPAKRRARMTPEEREIADMKRRLRRVERKQAWD